MFVITGGGSGIGRALAHALAARDQSVLVVGRRQDCLVQTQSFSTKIDYCVADVATEEGRHVLVHALQDIENVDGLIHNAGIIEPIMPLGQITPEAWRLTMATNLDAPLFLTQALYDKLHAGRVMHMGSGAAHLPIATWAAYCVSKASLAMLTRCWQAESTSIAFASVMPGIIDTPMQELIRQAAWMDPDKRDFFQQLHKNNQLLSCETVACFLTWLLLDVSRIEYTSQEWDIYDTLHHTHWLGSSHVPVF